METSKRVIGLIFIIISLIGLVAWEKWGKLEQYDDAVVLRDNVERGTVITESMLRAEKVNLDTDYLTYEERKQIIGKQTSGFVHEGAPLFQEYFNEPNLSPDEKAGTFALAFPEEWMSARPETLSRGDRVFFYSKGKCITSAMVSLVGKEGALEVIVSREQASALSSIAATGGKFMLIYQ